MTGSSDKQQPISTDRGASTVNSASPYVLPFFVYVLGVSLAAQWPDQYPLVYAAVVAVTAAVAWPLWCGRRIAVPHWRVGAAILVGLVGIVLWIGLSELRLEAQIAEYLPGWLRPAARTAYNPFDELTGPVAIGGFVVLRLVGLVVLVPLVEELFWRGFLLRWVVSERWQDVPYGRFTVTSFLVVTLFFTLVHAEWFAAAVYCALLNGLLYWKRDLWTCIVAHGVSNLVLALYILSAGAWWMW